MENSEEKTKLQEVLESYLEETVKPASNFLSHDLEEYGAAFNDSNGDEFIIFETKEFVNFIKEVVFDEELEKAKKAVSYISYVYINEEELLEDLLYDDDTIESALNLWKIYRDCDGYIILEN